MNAVVEAEDEVVEEPKVEEETVEEAIDNLLSEDESNDEPAPGEEGEAPAEEETAEEDTPKETAPAEEAGGEQQLDAPEIITPDYSVPDGLNERSSDRFNKLVEDNKAQREMNTANTETLQGMRQLVTDSGLTNDEYLGAIDFASLIKRDPEAGLSRMKDYMVNVSKATGIPVDFGEVDVLEDFPDLKEQVEDMALTKEGAIEIARARRSETAAKRQQQHADATSNEEQAYNTAKGTAIQGIATFLGKVSEKDIDWEKKAPILIQAAQFARENLHPDRWQTYLDQEYKKINETVRAIGKKRTQAPLADKSSVRGGEKEPQTVAEALDQLL